MICPICKMEIQNFNEELAKHLVVFKGINNTIHVHGPLENKELTKQFINEILIHSGLSDNFKEIISAIKDRKEIVFHNRQRIGDILMFSCGIRDFKKAFPDVRVNVISTAGHIWDNNPYIDRTLIPTEENTIKIGPGRLTNASNRLDWHFANAFRISIEDVLDVHIPQGESRPDIWFTEEEYNAPRVFNEPYWVIVLNGEKGWGCKMYPYERWQEFVNQNKDITFVQLGTNEDNPPRLQGQNIINFVGKTQDKDTGIRDLFKIFLNAEGSIGLVSFHMHLSGGLYKPAIIIAGAREPVSFTRYQGHQYLATEGCLPCAATTACWHCNIDTCPQLVIDESKAHIGDRKVPKCVDIIYPEDITRALNMYYLGGRLQKGVVSKKSEFKNIVKRDSTPAIPVKQEAKEIRETKPTQEDPMIAKYGMTFGSGSLTKEDWEFMKQVIQENNVKNILEFGSGISTLLLYDLGIKIISLETMQGWIDKLKKMKPELDIRLWDGENLEISEALRQQGIDMAFVDGPSGGATREFSTKIASELAEIVIIHDASRQNELKWQEKYLKGKFFGPGGGGKRCHLWAKSKDVKMSFRTGSPVYIKNQETKVEMYPPIMGSNGKVTIGNSTFPIKELNESNVIISKPQSIKFISTARGWGGCARSITTIMKYLLKAGHKVEFIPFRNSVGSHEFRECLNSTLKDVKVTLNYETLHEACDILFVYADDFVWEFNKPEIAEAFSTLNADKKIMMVNYRRGGVGEIEWTKGWDKYMFLNSTQEKELLKVLPNAKTKVLPPCIELDEFLKVQPNYDNNIRIVRHSSQGDVKFPKDFGTDIMQILVARLDVVFHMLPGPSFYNANDFFIKYPRTDKPEVIAEFLSKGNLFWYSLPQGYMDQGPRVILEAMAAGLPILADNWGGVTDRVTSECGWLCDKKEQFVEIIKNVTFQGLEKKGKAARERAITEFIPEKWIEEILC